MIYFEAIMDTITINITNVIGDTYAVEAGDGEKVFELVSKALDDKRKISVSFQNIEMITTAFLNTAFGKLYKDYSEDDIREYLSVTNITDSGTVALKRVIDTAKLFYKDPEAMQRSIDEIMEEE